MIHAVRFRNFKALRDVELELDRFTVLVGPNASGKTSVLEGLHHLTRLAATDPRRVFEGRANVGVLASRGAEGLFELALTGTWRRRKGDLAVSFNSIEDYPFSDTYRLESRWGDRRFSVRRELNPPDDAPPSAPGAEMPLGLVLHEAMYLRFELSKLSAPSYSDLPTPVIGPDGRGLAAVVADMAVARPDDFARLQEALRAILPGLLRVRLVRAKVPYAGAQGDGDERVWGHEIVFDMAGASDIPARAASEGVLLMLGLFATLLASERPELVLVDRLERAVSPRALGELTAQINQILALDPALQIVATSDSPALLDHQSAEAVRVHCLLEDGSVRIKPLVLHPDYDTLQRELRPGELWAQVGDAWVAEEPLQEGEAPSYDGSLDGGAGLLPDAIVPPPLPTGFGAELVSTEHGSGVAGEESPVPDTPAPETKNWPPSMPPLPTGLGRM
jgi:predicted ATPase